MLESDPLMSASEKTSVCTIAAFMRGFDELKAKAGEISLPLLVISGTADKVVLFSPKT